MLAKELLVHHIPLLEQSTDVLTKPFTVPSFILREDKLSGTLSLRGC